MTWWIPLFVSFGCAKRPPESAFTLEAQAARAAEEGPSQTLETVRLASMALAEGDRAVAERSLRQAVARMQDFRADGEFRAMVGAESRKEWKGEPHEKMMAFLYLGALLYNKGDYGNALAMTKSAILADTGTSRFQYRSDFVPAFLLQAMAYQNLRESGNADRSLQQAVDSMFLRELIQYLSDRLLDVTVKVNGDRDGKGTDAARVLLLSGIPVGLAAHPRDARAAIDASLSRATDLRMVVLDGKRRDWPEDLHGLSRKAVRKGFGSLEPLTVAWREALDETPIELDSRLAAAESGMRAAVKDDPSLVLWVETGAGPRKLAAGQYGQILIYSLDTPTEPSVTLDQRDTPPAFLDSVAYQATTRGSRRVDGLLKGKAVFKDAAPLLGYALIVSGEIANSLRDAGDGGELAAVLYILGGVVWVAGAVTNPRADTRGWHELPDSLWLVTADPAPGSHALVVDGRPYQVEIPDEGTVFHVIPALSPWGSSQFGTPCDRCAAPLAFPNDALLPNDRGGSP